MSAHAVSPASACTSASHAYEFLGSVFVLSPFLSNYKGLASDTWPTLSPR